MRCLNCESVLFLGGGACPRCGGEDVVEFSGPQAPARRNRLPVPTPEPAISQSAPFARRPARFSLTAGLAGLAGLLAVLALEFLI